MIGNLKESDLSELCRKDHPVRRRLRKRLANLDESECRKCKWKSICGRGCAAEAVRYGNPDGRGYMSCRINRLVFRELSKFYKGMGYSTKVDKH